MPMWNMVDEILSNSENVEGSVQANDKDEQAVAIA